MFVDAKNDKPPTWDPYERKFYYIHGPRATGKSTYARNVICKGKTVFLKQDSGKERDFYPNYNNEECIIIEDLPKYSGHKTYNLKILTDVHHNKLDIGMNNRGGSMWS